MCARQAGGSEGGFILDPVGLGTQHRISCLRQFPPNFKHQTVPGGQHGGVRWRSGGTRRRDPVLGWCAESWATTKQVRACLAFSRSLDNGLC